MPSSCLVTSRIYRWPDIVFFFFFFSSFATAQAALSEIDDRGGGGCLGRISMFMTLMMQR